MGFYSDDDDENEETDEEFVGRLLANANSLTPSFVGLNEIVEAYGLLAGGGRYEDAMKLIDMGLSLFPENNKLLAFKACLFVEFDKLAEAEAIIRYIKDEAEKLPEFHLAQAWLHIKHGRENDMLKSLKRAISLVPDIDGKKEHMIMGIGTAMIKYNQFELAVIFFEQVPEEFLDEDVETLFEYAYSLENVGRLDLSIVQYEKVVHKDPMYDSAWYNLGLLYSRVDRLDDALEAYTNCTDITPDFADAYYNRGSIYISKMMPAEALNNLTEYLSYDQPKIEYMAYAMIGSCLFELGYNDLAKEFYSLALKHLPKSDHVMYCFGRNLAWIGENHEAADMFEKAIAINPNQADYYFSLGDLAPKGAGQAFDNYLAGLRLDPTNVIAWYRCLFIVCNLLPEYLDEARSFIEQSKAKFGGTPKALLFVEAIVEFYMAGNTRVAVSMVRDVAISEPQVIQEAAQSTELKKFLDEKKIRAVIDDYNIEL